MKQQIDFDGLCRGQWDVVIPKIVNDPAFNDAVKAKGKKGVPCPLCGGRDRFSVDRDFADNGKIYCRNCGVAKHGISTLMKLLDEPNAREVFKRLEDYFGVNSSNYTPPKRVVYKPKPVVLEPDTKATARVKRLLNESHDPNHPWVQRYFRKRGFASIHLDPQVHRFHDSVAVYEPDDDGDGYHKVGMFPALLSLLTNPKGELVTLHQTFITPLGNKAPVPCVKKLMSPCVKDALRHTSVQVQVKPFDSHELGVCEGIELSYAVMREHDYPVWPTYSANFLSKFDPPPSIKTLHIWADLDQKGAGQVAAAKLARRLKGKVETIKIHFPFKDGIQPIPVPDVYKSEEVIETLTEHGFETCTVDDSPKTKNPDWEDLILAKTA